ncbi:hypothetical protein ACIQH6_02205 [Micromonospora orduensis]|uniref:hypothetical protein n=1 Tax=Micromonospora orduensis TaxID=1420891 RepID=UPI003820884C
MLANLLPGLRDLRAPLSAGFIWLLAGYLWLAPRLEDAPDQIKSILEDTHKLYNVGGTALLVSACAFTAYLIGILSVSVINPYMEAAFKLVAPIVLTIYLLPVLALSYALSKLTRGEVFQKFSRTVFDLYSTRLNLLARLDLGNTAKRLALDTAITAYRTDAKFRAAVRQQLAPAHFEQLVRGAAEPKDFNDSPSIARFRKYCKQVVESLNRNPSQATSILSHEIEEFEKNSMRDIRFLAAWMQELASFSAHAEALERELTFLPAKLVTASPDSYQRWDRLTAESEFRAALVAPLIGLGLTIADRGISPPIVIASSFMISWIIWAGSRIRRREALGQLSQCISGGVITSPELDRMREGFLNWKRQP